MWLWSIFTIPIKVTGYVHIWFYRAWHFCVYFPSYVTIRWFHIFTGSSFRKVGLKFIFQSGIDSLFLLRDAWEVFIYACFFFHFLMEQVSILLYVVSVKWTPLFLDQIPFLMWGSLLYGNLRCWGHLFLLPSQSKARGFCVGWKSSVFFLTSKT